MRRSVPRPSIAVATLAFTVIAFTVRCAKPTNDPPGPGASASVACPPRMARIPAGTLEGVRVSSFCLDVTEVTVQAWIDCVASATCEKASSNRSFRAGYVHFVEQPDAACNGERADRLDHPVNCVTFDQAKGFCARDGRRLPTESEWRWAARGARPAARFPWGDAPPDDLHVCSSSGPVLRTSTCPVGTHRPGDSPQGVQDLAGNVAEWTVGVETRPFEDRNAFGGSYDSLAAAPLGEGARHPAPPPQRSAWLGFRCAK